ncbi:MAG TPA: DUF4272 domain-containing protein [Bacteroidia bacterium]|jgi:hypothetical protein
MKKISFLLPLLFLFSCGGKKEDPAPEITPGPTAPVENINATASQSARRQNSERICKMHDLPVYSNPNALFVDPDEKVSIRSKQEVLDRLSALLYVCLKSEDLEQKALDKVDKEYGSLSHLSPLEKDYVTSTHPNEQQKIDANWRYECLHVLLWSLSLIDTLDYPDHMCNVETDLKTIHGLSLTQLEEKAKLRSKKEILDQADLILRINWACVNSRLEKQSVPGSLNCEVVQERHYTLNWLIRYLDQAWDEVSTDT